MKIHVYEIRSDEALGGSAKSEILQSRTQRGRHYLNLGINFFFAV
ncbi:Hypothetical protein CpCAPJ4_01325 [Corynebacterium pseudotuberculosis]|nr:Hypothetical protein CpCAP3W_01328 [Corynebacterium pseudotuberculosis]AUY58593.1 Hypothetical protein CpCAPJ4_01325 [Corynebacterium pseudotuberculosis]